MKKAFLPLALVLASSPAFSYNVQNNAMHYGAAIGDTSYVRDLLDGYSINLLDLNREGDAPLHIIAKNNAVSVFYVLHSKITPHLLEQQNVSGETPLITAVKNGNPDIAFLLVESGANPYAKDVRGFDSFYYAEAQNSELMLQILNGYNVSKDINEYNLKIESLKAELSNSENMSEEDQLLHMDKIKYYEDLIGELKIEINQLRDSLPKSSELVDLAPIGVNYTPSEIEEVSNFLKGDK